MSTERTEQDTDRTEALRMVVETIQTLYGQSFHAATECAHDSTATDADRIETLSRLRETLAYADDIARETVETLRQSARTEYYRTHVADFRAAQFRIPQTLPNSPASLDEFRQTLDRLAGSFAFENASGTVPPSLGYDPKRCRRTAADALRDDVREALRMLDGASGSFALAPTDRAAVREALETLRTIADGLPPTD